MGLFKRRLSIAANKLTVSPMPLLPFINNLLRFSDPVFSQALAELTPSCQSICPGMMPCTPVLWYPIDLP